MAAFDFAAHAARIVARLGQPVSITPAGQAERVVNAVFTALPAEAFGLVGGNAPTVRLAAADAEGLRIGDPVRVGERVFSVVAIDDHSLEGGDLIAHLEAA